MVLLYIFPHPDDESFGPARAMAKQIDQGHEVHLLTLTRGGATKQRHKYGLSIEEMGDIRFKEMLQVEKTLNLSSMTVLDMPDSGLKEMDPRKIEEEIADYIQQLKPDIIVSYPVYGISGFHDHLVMHAVIKRLYLELKDSGHDYLKRLAFFTLPELSKDEQADTHFKIQGSPMELVDCIFPVEEKHINAMKEALLCYETYLETIKKSGVMENISKEVYFEIFGETHNPPLSDLTEQLTD